MTDWHQRISDWHKKIDIRIDRLEERLANMDTALFTDRRSAQKKASELGDLLLELEKRFDDARSHEVQLIQSHEVQLVVADQLLERAKDVIGSFLGWPDRGSILDSRQAAFAWRDDYHRYLAPDCEHIPGSTAVEEADSGGHCQICEER